MGSERPHDPKYMIPLSEFLKLPIASVLRQKKTGESVTDDFETNPNAALLDENLREWLDKTRRVLAGKLGYDQTVSSTGVHPPICSASSFLFSAILMLLALLAWCLSDKPTSYFKCTPCSQNA